MHKICMAQVQPERYRKEANLSKAEEVIRKASSEGCDIVLFPEMFLTGYTVFDKLAELAEPITGESIRKLQEIAKETDTAVVMGFPEDRGCGKPCNSAVFIDRDGSIRGVHAKTHGWAEEEQIFQMGDSIKAYDTSFGRIGLQICYEIEFPEISRVLALDGAKAILMIAMNMVPDEELHINFMRARAMENSIYAFSANGVGDDGTYNYCGRSTAVDPSGNYLAAGDMETEGLLYAEYDSECARKDPSLDYIHRRRPELFSKLAG